MQGLLLSQRSSAVPDLQLSLLRCTASQTVKDVGGLSKSTMVVSFLRLPSLLNNKLVAWLSLLFAGGIDPEATLDRHQFYLHADVYT